MPGQGDDSHCLTGNEPHLAPWTPGLHGKFLIDDTGGFHSWRIREDLAPHHATAAEKLGVTRWVLDGIVSPDGTLDPTAMVPGLSPNSVLSAAA